ncbi:N1-acetylpolyamine oxidase [Phlyctema vagabunda]|uniref:Amine oxidase n=1 Tax=Phlyctema vagabunda TaxID=108571 RepID=A0ABR4P2C9_9HELO
MSLNRLIQQHVFLSLILFPFISTLIAGVHGTPVKRAEAPTVVYAEACNDSVTTNAQCQKTKVVVLGAGVAGITAAQALSNNSVSDFLIVEYNSEIGGRCRNDKFGKDKNGNAYTIELGANWIQGTVSEGGPENPIWTLAKKYKIANHFTNISSVMTFDDSGRADFGTKFEEFDAGYDIAEYEAGVILTDNLQDRSLRSGFNLAGYKPKGDAQAMAVEWYNMDFEYAQIPDVCSQEFTVANYNSTFYGFSEINNFAIDQRGFNAFIHGQASEFLVENDPRLRLSTVITNITKSDDGVIVYAEDGSCIQADYAITTFSVGVLQSEAVKFEPELPDWKKVAINTMQMGVYSKIFMQFKPEDVFWDKETNYFLYASKERGYYPVFQSLDNVDFFPGSGIFFVTVVTEQSLIVDQQSDEETLAQIMAVLRTMYPNTTIPDPIDFMYPRWSTTPWSYGSFSNWPPGLTLEGHQNLRAPVGRVHFAGEATSAEFYGYLHGAYFEGKEVGETIAACVTTGACKEAVFYEELKGTTFVEEYTERNGWTKSSFQTVGDNGVVSGGE